MSHICLLKGLLLKKYFKKYSLKKFQKIIQFFCKISLYYYVKIYVEIFKIYINSRNLKSIYNSF
jgi:hypothetical protein